MTNLTDDQRANVKRWVEELRKPERKQTKGALRSGDSFCCLGVLCDVHDPNIWVNNNYPDPEHGMRTGLPPSTIRELFGLRFSLAEKYVNMNDNGVSFLEIADQIEKDLLS